MDTFERAALARLPLAEAVWTMLRHAVSPEVAADLFERYRGTGCELALRFATLFELVADALLEHGGSGRRSFQRAETDGRLTVSIRAVYAKLSRLPLPLSQAFLSETTARLNQILPCDLSAPLPESLRRFQVVAIDGKKIKNLAKRLLPLRGIQGKALAGKGLVALLLNTQLAIAMEGSLDGEANDAPLTPALISQVKALLPGPVLYLADAQFCDLTIPRLMLAQGASFVVRFSNKMTFYPEKTQDWRDSQGREVCEEWGWLGSPKDPRRMDLRRLTLRRPGEADVAIVTNLIDADEVPGQDLLDVYLQRWTIERVFQQVTEVFELQRLIGSTPQGALFQFSLCLLLYNIIQIVRGYIAELEQRPAATISSELLFRDVRDQLTAANVMLDRPEVIRQIDCSFSADEVRERLNQLLRGQWRPTWTKSPPKRRSPQPTPRTEIPGGHSSAWKLIQAAKQSAVTSKHPP
jgi:hypothetical protein